MILGEGERRGRLERLITELGLSDVVCLPGFSENLYEFMREADLFVMSSL
jgi:glycosyltransferase involved in cell wall biosynthesis